MTAKYSTEQAPSKRWEADNRYVMAAWTTKPFVGVRHRYETVEHRLVIEYTHGVGVDIHHEVRSEDSGKFSDEWSAAESLEVREYGVRHDRNRELRWLQ